MPNLSVLHGWGEFEKREGPNHIVNGAKSGKQIKQAPLLTPRPCGLQIANAAICLPGLPGREIHLN